MKTHGIKICFLTFCIFAACNVLKLEAKYYQYPNEESDFLGSHTYSYGFAIKLSFEIGKDKLSSFRISASAGIAKAFRNNFMPGYQIGVSLYQGGLGNSVATSRRYNLQLDWINTFFLTVGSDQSEHPKVLYTFHSYSSMPLSNPYKASLTLGTNLVRNIHKRHQTVGFVNAGLERWQFLYYNEGPFFNYLGLGDGYDRWWTGGGLISWGSHTDYFQLMFAYDKFTGFSQDAFELSNLLGFEHTRYENPMENTYNSGRYKLEYIDKSGMAVKIVLADCDKIDFQNEIHLFGQQAYHPMVLKTHVFIGASFTHNSVYLNEF